MTKKNNLLSKMEKMDTDKQSRKRGVVAVFAHKELIQEARANGYSLKTIYQTLSDEGLMPITYVSFSRLVKKYLTDQPTSNTQGEEKTKNDQKDQGDISYKPDLGNVKNKLV